MLVLLMIPQGIIEDHRYTQISVGYLLFTTISNFGSCVQIENLIALKSRIANWYFSGLWICVWIFWIYSLAFIIYIIASVGDQKPNENNQFLCLLFLRVAIRKEIQPGCLFSFQITTEKLVIHIWFWVTDWYTKTNLYTVS